MVTCNSCHKIFPDYVSLAKHIAFAKHRHGRVWAAKVLLKTGVLDKKSNDFDPDKRIPLTDEDKEKKLSTIRQISGENEYVLTMCPKCRKGHRELLPMEFTRSSQAWRTGKALMVMCQNCGK